MSDSSIKLNTTSKCLHKLTDSTSAQMETLVLTFAELFDMQTKLHSVSHPNLSGCCLQA